MRNSMQAVVVDNGAVSVKALPEPTPGYGEVVVRVLMTGLCRTDLYVASGKIRNVAGPLVLGHEFSGLIESVGEEAQEEFRVGERVAINPLIACGRCNFCTGGDSSICQSSQFIGIDRDGCFAGFAVAPASAVIKVPDNISYLQAAYLEPVAASLAVLKTDIKQHQRGLVFGKNRFSELIMKILSLKGFNNISIYDPDDVNASLPDNEFDFIIETLINSESLAEMVRAVKPRGRIVLKSRQFEPLSFRMVDMIKKEPIFDFVKYGSFEEAYKLLADKQLNVDDLVDDIYGLDQYSKVFERSEVKESLKPFFAPWGLSCAEL